MRPEVLQHLRFKPVGCAAGRAVLKRIADSRGPQWLHRRTGLAHLLSFGVDLPAQAHSTENAPWPDFPLSHAVKVTSQE